MGDYQINKNKLPDAYELKNIYSSNFTLFFFKVMKIVVIRNFVIAKKKGKW